jgi:hypothetical protein
MAGKILESVQRRQISVPGGRKRPPAARWLVAGVIPGNAAGHSREVRPVALYDSVSFLRLLVWRVR